MCLFTYILHILINVLRPSNAKKAAIKLVTIGSDNGLSPDRRQAIIKPMLLYSHLDYQEQNQVKFRSEFKSFL